MTNGSPKLYMQPKVVVVGTALHDAAGHTECSPGSNAADGCTTGSIANAGCVETGNSAAGGCFSGTSP